MLAFIRDNVANIIISAVLIVIVAGIILSLIKKRKRNGSIGCGCSCDGCSKSQCPVD